MGGGSDCWVLRDEGYVRGHLWKGVGEVKRVEISFLGIRFGGGA
jgi:hypothetical protein